MPDTVDLNSAIFAKTALGQQEIQDRGLGLSLLVRRALVLVDGKRSGSELAVFLVGKGDIEVVLAQLMELGCIEVVSFAKAAPASSAGSSSAATVASETPSESPAAALVGLVSAEKRTDKDNEMARNFMINSINSIIGQNTRVTLVTDIFNAKGTQGLRDIYHAWEASMAGHGVGARRLPELREKLFKVL